MVYQFEYYYVRKNLIDLDQALLLTAKVVAKWCSYYRVELLAPKKGITNTRKLGKLPLRNSSKEKFIEGLFEWVKVNSQVDDLFTLFLDDWPLDKGLDQERNLAKFDHHDHADSLVLKLTSEEFASLKEVWVKNKLPKDLFFPPDKVVTKKILGGLLGYTCYTPVEWREKKKEEKLKKVY